MKERYFVYLLLAAGLFWTFVILLNANPEKPGKIDPIVSEKPITPSPENPPEEPLPPRFEEPVWTEVPIVSQRTSDGVVFSDVINRAREPWLNGDRGTSVHETTHRIHADLRNARYMETKERFAALYVLEGRAVFMTKPNGVTLRDVAAEVPYNLRFNRFNLYLVEQTSYWNDDPLYILDEFTAYVNGAACDVEDALAGDKPEWSDGLLGPLEFSYYAVALAKAIEKRDPGYFEREPQFLRYLRFETERACDLFVKGRDHEMLKWEAQEKLLVMLKADTSGIREFMEEKLDSSWLKVPTRTANSERSSSEEERLRLEEEASKRPRTSPCLNISRTE